MSGLTDNAQNEADLPVVRKCSSKNGSQGSASGSGGCGCKRRSVPFPSPDEPLPETTSVEPSTVLAVAETSIETSVETATATLEETPPEAACGCGHHAAESTVPEQADGAAGSSCKCQKLLWIRKTHSACGLIFGLFLVEHLAATALGLRPELFEPYMHGVHAAVRQTPWLEVLVLLPLITLVPFGLFLLVKAGLRYNVKKCKRGGKLRFFLQRVSAVVILAFVAFHLITLRNWGPWSSAAQAATGPALTVAGNAPQTAFATSVRQVWDFLPSAGAPSLMGFAATMLYLFGTAAVVYHLANGLWTGGIAWGLTRSDGSQQRSLWACTALGIMLLLLGTLGWYAFIVAPWSRAMS